MNKDVVPATKTADPIQNTSVARANRAMNEYFVVGKVIVRELENGNNKILKCKIKNTCMTLEEWLKSNKKDILMLQDPLSLKLKFYCEKLGIFMPKKIVSRNNGNNPNSVKNKIKNTDLNIEYRPSKALGLADTSKFELHSKGIEYYNACRVELLNILILDIFRDNPRGRITTDYFRSGGLVKSFVLKYIDDLLKFEDSISEDIVVCYKRLFGQVSLRELQELPPREHKIRKLK